MIFPSRSKQRAIEIWQTWPANEWGTRVRLVTPEKNVQVFENRREAIVYFVHVYWSPDETQVGVISTGANYWNLAFSTVTGQALSFDNVRSGLAESIQKSYHLSARENPLDWATSPHAYVAFFRLHPEIRLSYSPH